MLFNILFFLLLLVPNVVFGAAPKDFKEFVALALGYVKLFVALLFGITFVVFIWGIVKAWVLHGGNQENIEKGQQVALWGIIGLVVFVGMWGIITLLQTSLGLK